MSYIYFDNSASTPVAPEVRDEMMKYLDCTGNYANPSSVHMFGVEAAEAVENSRTTLAKYFNCNPYEVIFTGSGSESDNLAVVGLLNTLNKKGKHLITSAVEHPAILETFKQLARNGYDVTYLPVNNKGDIELETFMKAVRDDTVLASIMYVNNEVGTVQPIAEMAKYAKDKGVVFHTDAVQAGGKLSLDVQKLGVDMMTLSGHKIYAPKGVSALYVKADLMDSLEPMIFGGAHEFGKRSGSVATHQVTALAKACEIIMERQDSDNKHIKLLRDTFESKLQSELNDVIINGDVDNRVTSVSNLTFKYIDSEALLVLSGTVCSSPGSACSGDTGLSHVLEAMGVDPIDIRASLRFSFGRYNTMEEVETAVESIVASVNRLRLFSPLAVQGRA